MRLADRLRRISHQLEVTPETPGTGEPNMDRQSYASDLSIPRLPSRGSRRNRRCGAADCPNVIRAVNARSGTWL